MVSQCVSTRAGLVLVFAGWALSIELSEYKFLRNHTLDGYIATKGYIEILRAESEIHCGMLCGKNKDCQGFFYNKGTATCQLHPNNTLSTGSLQISSDTLFYLRSESKEEAQNANNGDVVFGCPENNGGWSTGMVANGSVYKYKLFADTKVTHAGATSLCQSAGGKLLKILTMEKLNFVINNLTECASVKDKSYWIDGTNYDAPDPYSPDAYKTSDNETIPQDTGLWAPGLPDLPDRSHCIWIFALFGYYFDDIGCEHVYTGGVYTICEKIVH